MLIANIKMNRNANDALLFTDDTSHTSITVSSFGVRKGNLLLIWIDFYF